MFKAIAIAERDLKSWLNTFSFYLLAVLFLGLTGYFFWSGLSYFSYVSFQVASNPSLEVKGLNLVDGVLSSFIANMTLLLLLLIPIFSMRSFSEERRQKTLELLFTYPVSDFQIIFGKFLALMGVLTLLVLPTVAYFFLAEVVGAKFELASLLAGYGGLLLVGASFIALGIFVSSLTEHQAVSAGVGFTILLFFWIVGWLSEWTSPSLGTFFRELSLTEHLKDLTRGIIDTKDVSYFVLFILFFLLATLYSLEVRSWKR